MHLQRIRHKRATHPSLLQPLFSRRVDATAKREEEEEEVGAEEGESEGPSEGEEGSEVRTRVSSETPQLRRFPFQALPAGL